MKLKDPRLEALVDTAQTFTHNDLKEITLAYQCAGRSGIEIVISNDSLLNNITKTYISKTTYIYSSLWERYIVHKINFIRFLFYVERE